MRALLLKPVALGAAICLAFFGVALLFVISIAAHASIAAAGSTCGSPPSGSAVPTSGNSTTPTATTGASSTAAGTSSTTGATQSATTTPAAGSGSTASSTSPTSAGLPQLCVEVDPYPSSGDVLAGDPASYNVYVWTVPAASSTTSNVTVTASPGPASSAAYFGSPSWVFPPENSQTVTLSPSQENPGARLFASVPTTSDAPAGTDIALTVTATATDQMAGSSSKADVVFTPAAAGSSGSNSNSSSVGSSTTVPPLVSLPPIPGTGVTATNPSDLFPAVSPSQGTGSLGLPTARARNVTHPATETAYAVPVDPRLLGGQIIGLVALLGAVTIAIVRLSVRKPQVAPSPPADPAGSPPTA